MRRGEIKALTGLRGVAILMVVFTHIATAERAAFSIFRDTISVHGSFHLPAWIIDMAEKSRYGVQLFFVLSAFTLTLQFARGRENNLLGYAWRRILRVAPGYWLAGVGYTLAVGASTARIFAPHGIGRLDLLVAALFGSAWTGGASLAVVPGGWSVCNEMAFYIVLPFLMWAIGGSIARALILSVCSMVVAQLWVHHGIAEGRWGFVLQANPIAQLPAFSCGIAAALMALQWRIPRVPGGVFALLALAIVACPFVHIDERHLLSSIPFVILSAGAIILAAKHGSAWLESPLMHKLGEVSYSLYLVHFAVLMPSLMAAQWLLPANGIATMMLYMLIVVSVSFGIAILTFKYIESPINRYAKRGRLLEERGPMSSLNDSAGPQGLQAS